MEPVRLLAEEGHDLSIFYSNSNIHPAEEYQRRLDTLLDWARHEHLPMFEDCYDAQAWHDQVGRITKEGGLQEDRCRMCYRTRLERAARFAAENGFEGLGSTLTVSPYQYTFIIEEELKRACEPFGLVAVFRDFRPAYPEATRRSKALGMYRQNYCGCVYSEAQARAERAERKAARDAEKARRAAERAPLEAAAEVERKRRNAERAEYDKKQRAKREARNKWRAEMKKQQGVPPA